MAVANRNGNGTLGGHSLEPIGVYLFSRKVLEHIPERGYQDIKEGLIPKLYKEGLAVNAFCVREASAPRVQDADSYLMVCKWLVEQVVRRGGVPSGYELVDEAWVHKSVSLDPTARLVGPVLVEPGCVIERGAIVTGPTTLGEGCTVAANAVVSRSVLWGGCKVGTGAIIDDSILTDDAKIDAEQVVRNTVCSGSRFGLSAITSFLRSCVQLGRGKNRLFERVPKSRADFSAANDQWLPVHPGGGGPVPSPAIVRGRRRSSPVPEGEKS